MCNWRPDSETVASRAFAHASSEEFNSWGVIILLHSQSGLVVETDWDLRPYFSIFTSTAFGPEGAKPSYRGFNPRVFRSVSWSRNGLDNHGGYTAAVYLGLMILMVGSRTKLITF